MSKVVECLSTGKRVYLTEEEAMKKASKNKKVNLKHYMCNLCKYYHLTRMRKPKPTKRWK